MRITLEWDPVEVLVSNEVRLYRMRNCVKALEKAYIARLLLNLQPERYLCSKPRERARNTESSFDYLSLASLNTHAHTHPFTHSHTSRQTRIRTYPSLSTVNDVSAIGSRDAFQHRVSFDVLSLIVPLHARTHAHRRVHPRMLNRLV
jgi:hypothetical protein